MEWHFAVVFFSGKDLEIHWGGKEGHIGFVPLSFLQANCYASKSLSLRREAAKLGLPLTVSFINDDM